MFEFTEYSSTKFSEKPNLLNYTFNSFLSMDDLGSNLLTLFRMGIFGAAHGWGEGGGVKWTPLPKICHTYPTMMKLGTVIP